MSNGCCASCCGQHGCEKHVSIVLIEEIEASVERVLHLGRPAPLWHPPRPSHPCRGPGRLGLGLDPARAGPGAEPAFLARWGVHTPVPATGGIVHWEPRLLDTRMPALSSWTLEGALCWGCAPGAPPAHLVSSPGLPLGLPFPPPSPTGEDRVISKNQAWFLETFQETVFCQNKGGSQVFISRGSPR